jgi:hypothetical protein
MGGMIPIDTQPHLQIQLEFFGKVIQNFLHPSLGIRNEGGHGTRRINNK